MFRRRRSAHDFAEEINSHLELEADELQSEGLSEDEARRRQDRRRILQRAQADLVGVG